MSTVGWHDPQRVRLLEEIPSSVMVIDDAFTIVDHNRAFAEIFGEVRGSPCYAATKRRHERCPTCPADETFHDGKRRVLEESGFDRAGRAAHYLVQLAPIRDDDGTISHVAAISTDLTVTRRLQREYQTLFEKVPCYVTVVNRELRVVRANELFRRVFGEPRGEHCYRLFKGRHEPCPECPVEASFADGVGHTARQVGVAADGKPTHYVVSTEPLKREAGEVGLVIEMALDVTEATRLEQQLARAHLLREALVENSPEAIVVLDGRRRVVVMNRAAEELWGRPRERLIGRRVPPRAIPAEVRNVLAGKEERCVLAETEVAAVGGERIPARLVGISLRQFGHVVGTAVIIQDLRPIRQLEREKLDAERLAAVGQTVAGLAHGIKNILTGLEGGMYVTSTGLKKGDERRVERGWEMLERNMGKISVLVRNLLAFSRGEEPRPEWIDAGAVAREVVDLYRDSARQHGVELDCAIDDGIAPVFMDREGLHSSLANLVSNALDACLVTRGEPCTIRVALREQDETLVFEVSDSGCGMDYEVKQKAFTSFFTTKGAGGTGLGLLITRKIVQQHGGSITFESTPGQGTIFRLSFPRARLPRPAERSAEGGDAT